MRYLYPDLELPGVTIKEQWDKVREERAEVDKELDKDVPDPVRILEEADDEIEALMNLKKKVAREYDVDLTKINQANFTKLVKRRHKITGTTVVEVE